MTERNPAGAPRPLAPLIHFGLCALLVALGLLLVPPAWGDDVRVPDLLSELKHPNPETRRHALLGLADQGDFDTVPRVAEALRDVDVITRKLAERALWAIWSRSGDEEVDQLMRVGTRLLANGRPDQSVSVFSKIIDQVPQFAEGWNKRATAYYHIGEFEKSLKDIDETLKRNPYHFGALSGAGLCMIELERFEQALGFFKRALEINPNLDGIQDLMQAVEQKSKKPLI